MNGLTTTDMVVLVVALVVVGIVLMAKLWKVNQRPRASVSLSPPAPMRPYQVYEPQSLSGLGEALATSAHGRRIRHIDEVADVFKLNQYMALANTHLVPVPPVPNQTAP